MTEQVNTKQSEFLLIDDEKIAIAKQLLQEQQNSLN